MREALTAAGAEVKLTVVPGQGHAMSYWSTVESELVAFVKAH